MVVRILTIFASFVQFFLTACEFNSKKIQWRKFFFKILKTCELIINAKPIFFFLIFKDILLKKVTDFY